MPSLEDMARNHKTTNFPSRRKKWGRGVFSFTLVYSYQLCWAGLEEKPAVDPQEVYAFPKNLLCHFNFATLINTDFYNVLILVAFPFLLLLFF